MLDDPDAAAEAALHAGLDANGLIKHDPNAMNLDYKAIFAQRPWDAPGYKPTTGPVYDEALAVMRGLGSKDSFGCIDVDDMLSEPVVERKWAWEGILGAGRSMLLAGDPKMGKSTFARVWAFATAAGVPFLSRSVQPGPVLWLACDGESKETFKLQSAALRPQFSIKHPIKWAGYADLPDVAARVAWLRDAILMHHYKLVIIDNIVNFFELGEQDTKYGIIAKATTPLLAVMQTTGCAMVMLTHTNNARRIFGGAGWTRVADINALYEQGREGARYLGSVLGGRDDTGFGPWAIGYDRATKLVFIDASPRDKAIREAEQALLSRPAGTREDIVRGCGYDMHLARIAFDNLVEGGLLVKTKVGRKEVWSDPESRPPSLSVVKEERSSSNVYIETDLTEANRGSTEPQPEDNRSLTEPPAKPEPSSNQGFVVTTGPWQDDKCCLRCGHQARCINVRGEGFVCDSCLAPPPRERTTDG